MNTFVRDLLNCEDINSFAANECYAKSVSLRESSMNNRVRITVDEDTTNLV